MSGFLQVARNTELTSSSWSDSGTLEAREIYLQKPGAGFMAERAPWLRQFLQE